MLKKSSGPQERGEAMLAHFTGRSEILSSEFVERSRIRLEAAHVEVLANENAAWWEPKMDFDGGCYIGEREIDQRITRFLLERTDEVAKTAST